MTQDELSRLTHVRVLARSGEAASIRRAARVSLSELASVVRVSPVTILRWERGERQPRGTAALRYEAALRSLLEQIREPVA